MLTSLAFNNGSLLLRLRAYSELIFEDARKETCRSKSCMGDTRAQRRAPALSLIQVAGHLN